MSRSQIHRERRRVYSVKCDRGPNHNHAKCSTYRYLGSGYNRVRLCSCGAEDHAPERAGEPQRPGIPSRLLDTVLFICLGMLALAAICVGSLV